ncbi:hypothetical protein [Mycobacterium spongiae]|nr:hypothetical protein [Mycobacterium spongiae]
MALWFPVHLNVYDVYGIKVSCGSGVSSNLTQAAQADDANLVQRCHEALMLRRAWAIPTIAIGWLLVTGFLVAWVHNDQQQKEQQQQGQQHKQVDQQQEPVA